MMKLLVYGTLKSGKALNGYLDNSRIVEKGEFTIEDCSLRGSSSYPCLYSEKGIEATKFYGEIFEVNEEVITSIDKLEGHPTFFLRKFIDKLDCFVYIFPHDDAEDLEVIFNY